LIDAAIAARSPLLQCNCAGRSRVEGRLQQLALCNLVAHCGLLPACFDVLSPAL